MSEQLILDVSSSFTRQSFLGFFFRTTYRFLFYIKVTDNEGNPVSGLTEENFFIRLAGNEQENPGSLALFQQRDPGNFPGFYLVVINIRFTTRFDIYQSAGFLFAVKVDDPDSRFGTVTAFSHPVN